MSDPRSTPFLGFLYSTTTNHGKTPSEVFDENTDFEQSHIDEYYQYEYLSSYLQDKYPGLYNSLIDQWMSFWKTERTLETTQEYGLSDDDHSELAVRVYRAYALLTLRQLSNSIGSKWDDYIQWCKEQDDD